MRFRVIGIMFFIFISFSIFGQRPYYATDTSFCYNVKFIKGDDISNAQSCRVKKGKERISFTPFEIKEYGLKDGRIYVAKDIVIRDSARRVFLERLNTGNAIIYYYRDENVKTFFFEKDSSVFVEIPKDHKHSAQLLQYTNDCLNTVDACRVVGYNKSAFKKLIIRYNECVSRPFPFLEYGLFFGVNQSRLFLHEKSVDEILTEFTYPRASNFYFGVFIDKPLFATDLSLFTSIGIYTSSFSANAITSSFEADLLINNTSIKVPVLLRYTLPIIRMRPYVNLGVLYTYNLRNESVLYEALIYNGVLQYETPDYRNVIATHQPGFVYGMGVQYDIDYRKMVFMELRFDKAFSFGANDLIHRKSVELLFGINF